MSPYAYLPMPNAHSLRMSPYAYLPISARTMHHLGASITLKRFSRSTLHARTPRQWHTVGEWLLQTLDGLAAPPAPYSWEPPRVDSVSIALWGPATLE